MVPNSDLSQSLDEDTWASEEGREQLGSRSKCDRISCKSEPSGGALLQYEMSATFIIYGCITCHHKCSRLKEHTFIIPVSTGQESGRRHGWVLCLGSPKAAIKVSVGTMTSSEAWGPCTWRLFAEFISLWLNDWDPLLLLPASWGPLSTPRVCVPSPATWPSPNMAVCFQDSRRISLNGSPN